MNDRTETLEFQAEARQLLQLMVHSVYSNKDVFLRELISNASDALDKVRLAAFVDKELNVDTSDLHIDIEVDPEARTLTVRDNGIGMTRDEVIQFIGTIAKSGTAQLVTELRAAKGSEAQRELIGQFGIGFYAAFMVADKVTLLTCRAGETEGTRWESSGDATYVIEPVDGALPGTVVTLHLKPADADEERDDYTDEARIRQLIKNHSDFIRWPIRLVVERTAEDGTVTQDIDQLNSMNALWARPREEVDDAEYNDFYRQISYDWREPLEIIRMRAEGQFEYEALLFIPSAAPFDMRMREARHGLQLYAKRVFIMGDCDALLPYYLRFVKGVVDAHDLKLNISRELLQQDRQIQLVRRRLVKKVLAAVADMQANRPDRYQTFWTEFGPVVKEGLISEPENQQAILEISSFDSTHDAARQTTLRQYIERMKEGQNEIYYLTGESRTTVENSPHLEAFLAKGYEVLILTDQVDEVWIEQIDGFDGKTFQSVAKGQVELDSDEERTSNAPARAQQQQDFAGLLSWLGKVLDKHVKQVRLSTRLTTSPACIVGDPNDLTPNLEKLYRASGQPVPPTKRILELNPDHSLIKSLREACERPSEAERPADVAELLYGTAMLAEGGDLDDPARFARLLADRLSRGL